MAENNSWEHPFQNGNKTEPTQSFEAFKIWLEMGNKRSLKAVAERVEKSHDTIKKYSCTWKWSERLQDKLSYENQQIHERQLEPVLTSLELDSKHDVFIQDIMGNVLYVLLNETTMTTNFSEINEKGRLDLNYKMDLIERLTNVYGKLNKIHNDTQQKLVNLNKECLKNIDFEDHKQYDQLINNGKTQQLNIRSDLGKYYQKLMKWDQEHDLNQRNYGGESMRLAEPFKSYRDQLEKLTGEDQKQLE